MIKTCVVCNKPIPLVGRKTGRVRCLQCWLDDAGAGKCRGCGLLAGLCHCHGPEPADHTVAALYEEDWETIDSEIDEDCLKRQRLEKQRLRGALVERCPLCGKQLPAKAIECPHCGELGDDPDGLEGWALDTGAADEAELAGSQPNPTARLQATA